MLGWLLDLRARARHRARTGSALALACSRSRSSWLARDRRHRASPPPRARCATARTWCSWARWSASCRSSWSSSPSGCSRRRSRTTSPLIWAFIFPVAVGYGIVRRQLFEIRNVAKSSAAYGAATLAITGVFAFAHHLRGRGSVSRLDISFRWFQVTFLFFAILAFNPLRNRLQALVDRFFDRDRETYRVAVREISEAMVSMLSLSARSRTASCVALTDTMGVERAMVMMVDDEGKVLRRSPRAASGTTTALDDRDPLRPPDLEAPVDAARGPLALRLRRRARRREPRDLPRRLRHARGRAAGPDPVRRRPARRDRRRPQDLRRAAGRRRPHAAAHAGEPELDRDRERQGLRRDREAERDARGARRGAHAPSCATPRPSSCRRRR